MPLPERARGSGLALPAWSFALLVAGFAFLAHGEERTLQLAPGKILHYRTVERGPGSARATAEKLLRHLAAGEIEDAAQLSNAPQRRFEELAKYRDAVGEDEFKRVFGQYFSPANRLVAEIAIDRHRLLVWNLGEAGDRLAGQYYVEVGGRFLMDDVPNATREQLRRVLEAYRSGKVRVSE